MASCFTEQGDHVHSNTRADFQHYRRWYGIITPEHERNIHLGDLGSFARNGEFVKLAQMFDTENASSVGKTMVKGRWITVPRPPSETLVTSEEIVFDPFVSRTTVWKKVPEERMER